MPSDGDEVVARGDDLGDVSLLFPRERDALLAQRFKAIILHRCIPGLEIIGGRTSALRRFPWSTAVQTSTNAVIDCQRRLSRLPILEEPFPGQQAAALFHVEHAIHNTVVTEKAFQLLRCCDVMIDHRQFPGVW
jgi:hypothetical protein